MKVTNRATKTLKRRRNTTANATTSKREKIYKNGVFGNISLVSTVARLFPNSRRLVDSLRSALARGNIDAAEMAVHRLMMTTNNVTTTTRLLRAWRAYVELQKHQSRKGVASTRLQSFQRQFGVNRPRVKAVPRRNMPRSNFNKLPNNLVPLITAHLDLSTAAKLATALGQRIPDPNNMKELGDIVRVSAKLAYAFRNNHEYNTLTQAGRVMGNKNFDRFNPVVQGDEEDGLEVRLLGKTYVAVVPTYEQEFRVFGPKGGFRFVFFGSSGWTVHKWNRQDVVPKGTKLVLTRELQRVHMARPRNNINNNENNNRNNNLKYNSNNNNAHNHPTGPPRPYPRSPTTVVLNF